MKYTYQILSKKSINILTAGSDLILDSEYTTQKTKNHSQYGNNVNDNLSFGW